MRRETAEPRHDWQARVEGHGFTFHSPGGVPYWDESALVRFQAAEIELLASATAELHAMCLEAVSTVVRSGDYAPWGLPDHAASLIERSWHAREPALLGRMDLAYTGDSPPKLLEYNADTPTALLEAAVVQWFWLEETRLGRDQFNRIHDALVERWATLDLDRTQPVHFTGWIESAEDAANLGYLFDTCLQAGFRTELLDVTDIGLRFLEFVDLADQPMRQVFKLYPWEWLLTEEFGVHLPAVACRWIEPAWKLVLANKSLLPLLWQLFPDHPNLLPAAHDPRELTGPLVAKPRFGREGEGVFLLSHGAPRAAPDTVYQAEAPLFRSEHGFVVVGSWVIGDEAAGLGLREDTGPVTGNGSRFIPHCLD